MPPLDHLQPGGRLSIAATNWLRDRLSRDEHLATADFIAHAHQDIPRLVEALEEAWAELGQLRGV